MKANEIPFEPDAVELTLNLWPKCPYCGATDFNWAEQANPTEYLVDGETRVHQCPYCRQSYQMKRTVICYHDTEKL